MQHLHIENKHNKAKVQPSDKKSEKKELKLEKNLIVPFAESSH